MFQNEEVEVSLEFRVTQSSIPSLALTLYTLVVHAFPQIDRSKECMQKAISSASVGIVFITPVASFK